MTSRSPADSALYLFQAFHVQFLIDTLGRPRFGALARSEGFTVIDARAKELPATKMSYVES
jgi:hypothetical protein